MIILDGKTPRVEEIQSIPLVNDCCRCLGSVNFRSTIGAPMLASKVVIKIVIKLV